MQSPYQQITLGMHISCQTVIVGTVQIAHTVIYRMEVFVAIIV